jgi:type IV secretory pathway VirB10-like protein
MAFSKASMALAAALCAGAGAGGTYLATRSSAPPAEATTGPLVSPEPAAVAVDQSEAVVASEPVAPTPVAAPAPRAAAPRRDGARATRTRATRAPGSDARAASAPEPAPRPEPRLTPPALEASRPVDVPVATRAPEPPAPQFEELVVDADSVIGLQIDSGVTSETARVEDAVTGRVTRDVRVGDRVAIPAGARAEGEVTLVERGGKVKDRARLGVRFTSIVLADGTRVPLDTETIYREGNGPSGESAAKIGGGAIGGAILGGILGGAKGAILGGSAGAGAGTAVVLAGGRNPATLPAGTPVTVRVTSPATVTVEK